MPSPALVAAAAEARASGDWRGAAALMPVDVDVDLAKVRDGFGAEAAAALEDDLRHLCLDLLWWHLPRHRGGMTTMQGLVSAVLAPESGAGTAPLLRVRLPRSPTGPQRVRLGVATLAELEYERWYLAPRYTWDVRATAGLRSVWAEPQVYSLLSDGDFESAWRRCGITLNFTDPAALQRPSAAPTSPLGVAEQARAAARAFGVDSVATLFGAYLTLHVPDLTADAADPLTADASDPSEWLEVPVRIPTGTVPPDLALLAAGLMSPSDLHPLMRAALFPEAGNAAVAPESPQSFGHFRARCRDGWHRLSIAGGTLRLHDHDEVEQLREATLHSLGGAVSGCYAVREAWHTGVGRLPRALRDHRREVVHRLQHGDTEFLLTGLADGTIDPRMRTGNGWSLLHMVMWLDHERALGPLLAAGLEVDVRDRIERTPLYAAVMNGGDPELVRRLLAAGADPRAETVHGAWPAGVARSRGDWRDLRFLAEL
ncbi:ankyrin repeat domain-containing protein [Dactylosporangium sp. NPDC048998]|uniref:ankyrin repeat domain-containing protein n=1 Tax=Dactylosporangium sp. NPDC048998 TaxID=3363976 RepID=UPI00371DDB92